MTTRLPALEALGDAARAEFHDRGFLVVEGVLGATDIVALRERFEPLFRGEFETGVHPDEWHWQEGVSRPDLPRYMANAWKSDLSIARLVLAPEIAVVAAMLAGWNGTRLGQDTLWMKPPAAGPVAWHQDAAFTSFLRPDDTVTCWVTLDDTFADVGTVEYAAGSHTWPLSEAPANLLRPHSSGPDLLASAAAAAGAPMPEIVPIRAPAGSCVFHHGRIWHGSGRNRTADATRRSVGIHLLPASVLFGPEGGRNIYGRYQRAGESELDENFFPILWSRSGYRTEFLDAYLRSGSRTPAGQPGRQAS